MTNTTAARATANLDLDLIARRGQAPVHIVRLARVISDIFATNARVAVKAAFTVDATGTYTAHTLRTLTNAGGYTYDIVRAAVDAAEADD